ncbi:MAG: MMPL family transporter [Candidatus Nanopelagicales bacterium]
MSASATSDRTVTEPSGERPQAPALRGFRRALAWPAGRRARFVVLALWVLVLALAGPLAGRLEKVQSSDPIAALAPAAESTQVAELVRTLPGADQVPAVIVYQRASGLTAADQERIAADKRALAANGVGVGEVTGPVPSQDGQAAILAVPLTSTDPDALADDVATIRTVVAEGDAGGLAVRVTGGAGITADLVGVFAGVNSTLLLATALVVAILLLITYRSPFLWLVPLFSVFMAEFLARAGMTALVEQRGLLVDGQISGIVLVLVFGAGTDYALLLVARYREELRRHEDRGHAMAAALAGAGPAIVASAATVALGLLCLLAAVLPGQRALGPAGALGVLIAMVAALTLLPALLLVCGRRVFWPFVPRYGTEESNGHGTYDRVGRRVARSPRRVWIGGLAVLGVLCFGLTQFSLGQAITDSFRGSVASIEGRDIVAQHFPAGTGSDTVVLVAPDDTAAVTAALKADPGVAAVRPGAASAEWQQLSVTLADPADSEAAYGTVERLRGDLDQVGAGTAIVGGTTAQAVDERDAQQTGRDRVIPLVLALVLVVLIVLLRALVLPLLLVATVVVSFAASLGVTAWLSGLLGFGSFNPTLPLFAFVFLVALGVDYNIFLMARAREEAVVHGTREGMLRALAVTGGVITSAGLVLAATFAVLGVLPLVALAQLGFVVAFGVLLDTLIVRTLIVPGLVLDLGDKVWWPAKGFGPGTRGSADGERAEVTPAQV